jgi:tetratricopeptide (TPR) repeat protein
VVKNQHTCRNCGNKVRLGSSFCDTCGTRLEAMEVPVGELRNSSEMYFNTGQIYEDKGLLDKALEYYNQAVAQDATNARYQLSLGRVLEKNGLLNDAYEVFTKIPESDLLYDEARRYSRNINLKQAIIENLNNIGNF